MRREFIPFDKEIIQKELDALPAKDAGKLVALMGHYETVGLGNPSPVMIDDYGDGIYRLRHIKAAYQGRMLFFAIDRVAGFERLVLLTAYKKEGQKTPESVIETAKRRKREWEQAKKSQ